MCRITHTWRANGITPTTSRVLSILSHVLMYHITIFPTAGEGRMLFFTDHGVSSGSHLSVVQGPWGNTAQIGSAVLHCCSTPQNGRSCRSWVVMGGKVRQDILIYSTCHRELPISFVALMEENSLLHIHTPWGAAWEQWTHATHRGLFTFDIKRCISCF